MRDFYSTHHEDLLLRVCFCRTCISGVMLLRLCHIPLSQRWSPASGRVHLYAGENNQSASSREVRLTTAAAGRIIDTTINIHFNDYDCLDIQEGLGVVYLNP